MKRGISPLISTVLIIAFVIILFVSITVWIRQSIISSAVESVENKVASELQCMNTRFFVKSMCLIEDYIRAEVDNVGNNKINSFLVNVYGSDDNKKFVYEKNVSVLRSSTFEFDFKGVGEFEELNIAPVIDEGLCIQSSKSFSNVSDWCQNMVKDPYFEYGPLKEGLPGGYYNMYGTLSQDEVTFCNSPGSAGKQCVYIYHPTSFASSLTSSYKIPVIPDKEYYQSAWFKTVNAVGSGMYLGTDWRRADGSRIYYNYRAGAVKPIDWTFYEGTVTAPTEASYVHFWVLFYQSSGEAYIDDIEFKIK